MGEQGRVQLITNDYAERGSEQRTLSVARAVVPAALELDSARLLPVIAPSSDGDRRVTWAPGLAADYTLTGVAYTMQAGPIRGTWNLWAPAAATWWQGQPPADHVLSTYTLRQAL
jgi:hypothetical protein